MMTLHCYNITFDLKLWQFRDDLPIFLLRKSLKCFGAHCPTGPCRKNDLCCSFSVWCIHNNHYVISTHRQIKTFHHGSCQENVRQILRGFSILVFTKIVWLKFKWNRMSLQREWQIEDSGVVKKRIWIIESLDSEIEFEV